jgi:hypothetical protein
MARPRVGSVAWERAGGPPLSLGQRLRLLAGGSRILISDLVPRLLFPRWSTPSKVDLARWSPPDTSAARAAEGLLRAVSNAEFTHHCLRTYYFSAIRCELGGMTDRVDKETLYVAAVLHDVGLFASPGDERCFTVASAREARRIATEAGWDEARQDRMAMAITSNLNSTVPLEEFGPEAFVLSEGGIVEVAGQPWKVHPENLAEILGRFPRDGFVADSVQRVRSERERHPGCRWSCYGFLFPWMLRRADFTDERRR